MGEFSESNICVNLEKSENPWFFKIEHFSKLILNDAIKKGGSSIRNFKNVSGKNGTYQNEFKVYQRENLNCLKEECFGKIKKKFISKRSTFFCNKCQK